MQTLAPHRWGWRKGMPEQDSGHELQLAYKVAQNRLCNMIIWSPHDHVSHICWLNSCPYIFIAILAPPTWVWKANVSVLWVNHYSDHTILKYVLPGGARESKFPLKLLWICTPKWIQHLLWPVGLWFVSSYWFNCIQPQSLVGFCLGCSRFIWRGWLNWSQLNSATNTSSTHTCTKTVFLTHLFCT